MDRIQLVAVNIVLLVKLAGTAWLLVRSIRRRVPLDHLVRWQTSYLPVFARCATAVVVVLPPLFGFE